MKAVKAIGTDVVDVERIDRAIKRHGMRFLQRIFTEAERRYCEGQVHRSHHYAGRFAAKEAVLKVLGTGLSDGVGLGNVEIRRSDLGQPSVALTGRADEVARRDGIGRILVSLSHTRTVASAMAIGLEDSP